MRIAPIVVTLAAIPVIIIRAPGFGLTPMRLGQGAAASRMHRVLPLCPMPVSVPDLARSEAMPGSHGPTRVGTEAFGCTNPLGPRATATH
jgi:hypothetical protein